MITQTAEIAVEARLFMSIHVFDFDTLCYSMGMYKSSPLFIICVSAVLRCNGQSGQIQQSKCWIVNISESMSSNEAVYLAPQVLTQKLLRQSVERCSSVNKIHVNSRVCKFKVKSTMRRNPNCHCSDNYYEQLEFSPNES